MSKQGRTDRAGRREVERRTVLLAGGAATTAVLTGCVVQQAALPATSPTSSAPVSQGTTGPAPLAKVADIPAGGGVILLRSSPPTLYCDPFAGCAHTRAYKRRYAVQEKTG